MDAKIVTLFCFSWTTTKCKKKVVPKSYQKPYLSRTTKTYFFPSRTLVVPSFFLRTKDVVCTNNLLLCTALVLCVCVCVWVGGCVCHSRINNFFIRRNSRAGNSYNSSPSPMFPHQRHRILANFHETFCVNDVKQVPCLEIWYPAKYMM